MKKTNRKARRGVVVVLVALGLTFILGMVAIAIDGGMLYMEWRRARMTADAAAMAAACCLYENYPSENGKDPNNTAKTAAINLAASNEVAQDTADSTVTVNIPPASGPYAGKDSFAEVIVTLNVKRRFSIIFGSDRIPVKARAVSRGDWTDPKAGVIILDYDDRASLNAQGNGAFTETGGPVIVNSNNPSALVTAGNGTMYAQEFDITGGLSLSGNAQLQSRPDAGLVYTGTHPVPDPLAYLPVPDVPPDGTMTTTNLGMGNKQYVLTPGRYSNLPQFNTGDVVIFQQASAGNGGIFYVDGGGFKSTGATLKMDDATSGGMMLYNKPQNTSSNQKIQITGNPDGTVDLEGLRSGPYSGMMLWQDRTSPVDALVEGNGKFSIKGTFYLADAKLNINGNGKTSTGDSQGMYLDDNGNWVQGASRIGSQFITNNLSLGGNGNIKIDYKGPDVARTRIITLVE